MNNQCPPVGIAKSRALLVASALALLSLQPQAPAHALDLCPLDIRVTFSEGAPRDAFLIENKSQSNWELIAVTLDLRSADGGLFFDTTAGGKGSSVYQLYRTEGGSAQLQWVAPLADGATEMTLNFKAFPPGRQFRFSTDLDTTFSEAAFGTQVRSEDLNGALLRAMLRGPNGLLSAREGRFGAFGDGNTARISPGLCMNLS